MRRFLTLLSLVAITGCSGSNAVPIAAPQVDLGQFVRDQVAATSDTTDPVDVNAIDFDDQTAFDAFLDLLQ